MGRKLTPDEERKKAHIEKTHRERVKAPAFRQKDPSWKPPENAEKPDEEKEPHAEAQEIIRGNLARGSHMYVMGDGKEANVEKNRSFYAWNGWNYIGSTGARMQVYESSPFLEYKFFSRDYRANFYQSFPLAALGQEDEVITTNQRRVADLWAEIASTSNAGAVERHEYRRRYYSATSGIFFRQRNGEAKARRLLKEGKSKRPYQRSSLVGCSLPYRWEAHHLLPAHFFYKFLEMEHVELVLQSTYDINDGRNVMFLPTSASKIYWKPHKLPYHLGSHPDYDQQMERHFNDVKKKLEEIKGKELPHPDSPDSVEAKLHKVEARGWKLIRLIGSRGPTKLS